MTAKKRRQKPAKAEEAVSASKLPAPKRRIRDSVFTLLFRIKKYLMMLYTALNADSRPVTEDDLTYVTLRAFLVSRLYNDLGFIVGDRLIILVEAQSTWSVNIIIREMIYLLYEYTEYIRRNHIDLFGSTPVKLPKPMLYVLYTGPGEKPDELLLSKEFFSGEQGDIEVRVRVIRNGAKKGDIIDQYVTFCDVWNDQRKLHGQTAEAIRETIRICKTRNVLREFLEEYEQEVYTAMEIFDDDFITEAHDRAVREEGRAEGREEGRAEGREEGRTEGRAEGARNNAFKNAEAFLKNGVSIDVVAKSIPILTFDEVRAIEAGMLRPV